MITFSPGDIFAEHYELKQQLGHGSFGNVWLAHNLLADIDVAIKMYGTYDASGIEEFRKEFKIAYKLNHPNLLNINHFDVCDNIPYLVMPYCSNGSVASRAGSMTESELWKFILDVSNGLAFLHSQQPAIVHQDIKPDNILITEDGRYVISDFGISRTFKTKMSTTMGNTSGTLAYMSPERFSQNPMIVIASDIWAFGMTLYELITGNVLWEGMGGCVQLNGAQIPTIRKNISTELTKLVMACLKPETWNRPTATQIHEYATRIVKKDELVSTLLFPDTPSKLAQQRQQQQISLKRNQTTHTHQYSNQPAPTQSNGWKKWVFSAVAACLACLALWGGMTYFHNMSEKNDFISCQTKQDFERFINEHPNSDYVETAKLRIKLMTKPQHKEVSKQQPLATTPTQPAQPTSTHKTTSRTENTVKTIIVKQPEVIRTEQDEKRDDYDRREYKAYASCKTIYDYQRFLAKYPNGPHEESAKRRLQILIEQREDLNNHLERLHQPKPKRKRSFGLHL